MRAGSLFRSRHLHLRRSQRGGAYGRSALSPALPPSLRFTGALTTGGKPAMRSISITGPTRQAPYKAVNHIRGITIGWLLRTIIRKPENCAPGGDWWFWVALA